MKLKELIVKESNIIKELTKYFPSSWEDFVVCVTQDADGALNFWGSDNLYFNRRDWWSVEGNKLLEHLSNFPGELADDYKTAIIKKEEYKNMTNKKDIYKVAFQTNTVPIEKIQLLYDVLHENEVDCSFKSALDQSTCHNRDNNHHITFLSEGSGMDGSVGDYLGKEIISFDEFYELLKTYYSKNEEVKRVASPRYHKKRIPVPVRKKVDVILKYKDGSKYTFKDVVYWNATTDCFFVKERKSISEGIDSSVATDIDKEYIQNVTVKEVGGKLILTNLNKESSWLLGSYKFYGEGFFSKDY